MSNNDFDFSFDSGGKDRNGGAAAPLGSGGWHVALTVMALFTVAALSMGMAFLTKDVEERPVWMMGLIFMIPAAALMLGCMIVESATSAMTPGDSRRPQVIVALAAVAATFLVGCLCDLVYLSGFKSKEKIVIVIDKSDSMRGKWDNVSNQTLNALLDQLTPNDYVGAISFSDRVLETAPLALKTSSQDAQLRKVVNTPPNGMTDFYLPLTRAMEMVEQSDADKNTVTKVIFSTDGSPTSWGDKTKASAGMVNEIVSRCRRDNIQISGIQIASSVCEELREIINGTGGQIYQASNAEEFLQSVTDAASLKDKDLMRSESRAAKIITFVMLLLEGLSLGICLSLMLSRRGQFRFQYILTPLMGILAFVALKLVFPKLVPDGSGSWWMAEGLSLSLLGLVFMRRNDSPTARKKHTPANQPAQDGNMFEF